MMLRDTVADAMLTAYDDASGDLAIAHPRRVGRGPGRGRRRPGPAGGRHRRRRRRAQRRAVEPRRRESARRRQPHAARRAAPAASRLAGAAGAMASTFRCCSRQGSTTTARAALDDALATTRRGAERRTAVTNFQPTFWKAVLLAKAGRIDERARRSPAASRGARNRGVRHVGAGGGDPPGGATRPRGPVALLDVAHGSGRLGACTSSGTRTGVPDRPAEHMTTY